MIELKVSYPLKRGHGWTGGGEDGGGAYDTARSGHTDTDRRLGATRERQHTSMTGLRLSGKGFSAEGNAKSTECGGGKPVNQTRRDG